MIHHRIFLFYLLKLFLNQPCFDASLSPGKKSEPQSKYSREKVEERKGGEVKIVAGRRGRRGSERNPERGRRSALTARSQSQEKYVDTGRQAGIERSLQSKVYWRTSICRLRC